MNLTTFETTKGHYGNENIYKLSLEKLKERIDLNYFKNKVAHIKACGNGGETAMADYYRENGFTPIISLGNFKHFDQSHFVEYAKDVAKIYHDNYHLLDDDYTLLLEGDWLFTPFKNDLKFYLDKAQGILADRKDILTVRFPHHADDNNHYNSTISETVQDHNLNLNDSIYSMNPHVLRTRDLNMISFLVRNNLQNCNNLEVLLGHISKSVFPAKLPFAAFDPSEIRCRHIGVEKPDEELAIIEKEFKEELDRIKS